MEVQFSPEVERQLNDLATESGVGTNELLQDALAGYLEEVGETRRLLDRRYDELRTGAVKAIPGAEVEAYFREKSSAARSAQSGK